MEIVGLILFDDLFLTSEWEFRLASAAQTPDNVYVCEPVADKGNVDVVVVAELFDAPARDDDLAGDAQMGLPRNRDAKTVR